MGWQNPPLPWSELERRLAGRPPPANQPPGADGGDAPAWSSRRQPYRSPGVRGPGGRGRVVVPYAELHCHSNASFLDGGSHPEELAEEAAHLRLEALAITDHDGMYGIVRFAEAARALPPTIFGAELTLVPGARGPRPRRPGGPTRPGRQHGGAADGDARPGRGASGGAGAGAGGVCAVVPGDLGGADGRGQGGAPGGAGAAGRVARRALGGADRVPEGGGGERAGRPGTGGGRGRAGPARPGVRAGQRLRGDLGPRRPARLGPQRRPGPAGRPGEGRGGGDQQRPLRDPGTAPAGHRAGRGPGPQLPGRPGRLAARRGRRPSAVRARAGDPPGPLPGDGRAGRRARPVPCLRPGAGRAPPARLPGPARPHRDDLAARAGQPGRDPPLRPPARRADPRAPGARSTTSWT